MTYLSRFNDTFIQMISDLVDTFPSDAELRLYKFGLNAAIQANPTMVSDIFYEKVVNIYEQQIKSRDESFFLNKSFNEYSKCEDIGDIISKIKSRWVELSHDNKDTIWKYLLVLVAFSKKIKTE